MPRIRRPNAEHFYRPALPMTMGKRIADRALARHQDSRRCLLLLRGILETPGLTERLLDVLKPVDDDPAHDYREDLKTLEKIWMEKLQPYGDRGYH